MLRSTGLAATIVAGLALARSTHSPSKMRRRGSAASSAARFLAFVAATIGFAPFGASPC